jgi:uncharacterized protein (DUF885 family)
VTEAGDTLSRFDGLLQTYYRSWFRFHPEAAVEVGVDGYERLLTPFSDEARGALVCLNNELLVSLDELDHTRLNPEKRIDFKLLYGSALLENQRLLDVDPRRPDPARFLPINAIYQLTVRPVADLTAALTSRIAAIPQHLDTAAEYLRPKAAQIPPLWLDSSVISARRAADFVRELATLPIMQRMPKTAVTELESGLERSARAFSTYAEFLDTELRPVAKGDYACGSIYFENLLSHRHFLAVHADALRELGQQIFDQTKRDLVDACKQISGGDDITAAVRRLQSAHPARAELLEVYRREMAAAREFVARHELVSLPARERLDVVETPVFLRHQIPFAAYHEPSPADPEQHGYYYVTPPRDDAELAEHDHAGLKHTCVHEAWPGHHLQFVTANLNPMARTLPRLLNPSATLYEGWALYCEQMMHEQGFLDSPQHRFILLRDRLWRALRILIDVDLHTRGLTLEAAVALMMAHLGFPRSQALADLTWYTRSPTVPSGYATGWAVINSLRDRLHAEEPTFGLKAFHDRLLASGSAALPLAVEYGFGAERWTKVKQMLFGDISKEKSRA